MSDMLRDDLLERLDRLDEDASLMFDGDERFHLVIVGGGALILLERISRATHDVDAISASHEILELLEKYDINCRVQTYINNFPYNYEDRLVSLSVGGRKIDFYTASLEDIVIAKLYSARATDIRDVESEKVVEAIVLCLTGIKFHFERAIKTFYRYIERYTDDSKAKEDSKNGTAA